MFNDRRTGTGGQAHDRRVLHRRARTIDRLDVNIEPRAHLFGKGYAVAESRTEDPHLLQRRQCAVNRNQLAPSLPAATDEAERIRPRRRATR